jgi:hypothetical protein
MLTRVELERLGPRFLVVTVLVRDTVVSVSASFFLSSYLITSLLIMERRTSGIINLKSFTFEESSESGHCTLRFLVASRSWDTGVPGIYQPSSIRRHEHTRG